MPPIPDDTLERLAQLDSQFASLRGDLERTQRLATLGTLAAGIAHEVNNILTPVLSYAAMAQSNPEDNELVSKALARTVAGVESASKIVRAMLGFAGPGDDVQEANVSDILAEALSCVVRDPAKDRIVLTTRINSDTCVMIRPLALQQVLVNLILNAVNAMRGRGGELHVLASQQGNGKTTISVADNGPGLPPSIAGHIFEPFVSHRRPRKAAAADGKRQPGGNQPMGSGLGLAICKQLIEQAGGTIAAGRSPSGGAMFTITLDSAHMKRAKAG
jgi:signal transduction histidine kinase